jgi:hypothetical protein
MSPLQVFVIQIPSSPNQVKQDDSICEEFEDAGYYADSRGQIIVQLQYFRLGHNIHKD